MQRTRQTGLCAFYIDLDGFKTINDQYGHDVGHDVLQQVLVRPARPRLGATISSRISTVTKSFSSASELPLRTMRRESSGVGIVSSTR